MSLVEENKESEKQHYQTKNSFQLELLEAVRRRQRQLLGPDDDVDTNTQRHSKELDAKMAKFLSNKQYSLDDSERESSSYQGETARTMDPSSSTSVVNNTRTTTRARVDGVKWEPSITLESDDEVDEYISSDEDDDDDDIVIGSNVRLPNKTTSFGNNTEVPIKTRGLHEASGETGLGLGGKNSSNDKREIDSYERRQSKEDNENTGNFAHLYFVILHRHHMMVFIVLVSLKFVLIFGHLRDGDILFDSFSPVHTINCRKFVK